MSDDQNTADGDTPKVKHYRHDVIKMIMDRPDVVVYATDIARKLDLDQRRVGNAVRRYIVDSDSPARLDIEVVIPARAWRYRPPRRARRGAPASEPVVNTDMVVTPVTHVDGDERGATAPLTHSIRRYFQTNPNRTITLDTLVEMMSTDDVPLSEEKVKIGLNNAKISDAVFRDRLVTIVRGRSWHYVLPSADGSVPGDDQSDATTVDAPTVAPPTDAPTDSDNMMILERVGNQADGTPLVRDENQVIYQLKRL